MSTALVRQDAAPVAVEAAMLPQVTPQEARAAMSAYLELCESVLGPEDYQEFTERGKTKSFKKKSAVKKLQTFFGVEVTCPQSQRDELGDGHFGFRVLARATAKGGRVVESWGACSTHEERFTPKRYDNDSDAQYAEKARKMLARSYHDVLATAETRASNRAVMNLIGVGGGEVTADEISRTPEPRRERNATPPADPADALKKQQAALFARARECGVDKEDLRDYILAKYNVESTKDLTPQQRYDVTTDMPKIADAVAARDAAVDEDELPGDVVYQPKAEKAKPVVDDIRARAAANAQQGRTLADEIAQHPLFGGEPE